MVASVMGQLAYLGWSLRVIVDFARLWSWFNEPGDSGIRLFRESFMPHKTLLQIVVAHLVFGATLGYSVWVGMRFGRGLRDVRESKASSWVRTTVVTQVLTATNVSSSSLRADSKRTMIGRAEHVDLSLE
jgi:hypothetical protein